jgi:hypothetical protein
MASRRVGTLPGAKVLVHHSKSGRSTSAKCQKQTSADCFGDHEFDRLLNGIIGVVLLPAPNGHQLSGGAHGPDPVQMLLQNGG